MILTFLTGFAFEAIYVCWAIAASRGYPIRAALLSAGVGALSLYGITAVVHNAHNAPALILGYALGSYCVVRFTPKGG